MRNQIKNVINEYQKKIDKVQNNKDLSAQGKKNRLDKLTGEKKDALKAFVPELRRQAVKAGLEARRLQGCAWASGQLDSEKWDYSRLMYESNAAKAQVRRVGGDVFEVVKEWDKVKNSGDKYKIKAYIDTVPLEIKQTDNRTYSDLMQDMSSKSNIFEKSIETGSYETGARSQLAELADLERIAAKLDGELYPRSRPFGPNPVTQKRILKGIHLADGKIELDFQLDDNAFITDDERFDKLYG